MQTKLAIGVVCGSLSMMFAAVSVSAAPESGDGVATMSTSTDVDAPQFYDPNGDFYWNCMTPDDFSRDATQLDKIWSLTREECFPGFIVVPYRIVTEIWYELDADGNEIDPDYTKPPEEGTECDSNPVGGAEVADENMVVIFQAMAMIESASNVRFVERNPRTAPIVVNGETCVDPDRDPWIRIMNGNDCPGYNGNFSNSIGMLTDPGFGADFQEVVILNWSVGVMAHELMHAVGMWHEQSRPDRDEFIQVNWENMSPGCAPQWYIADTSTMIGDYDFYSIMHYSQFACSNNLQPTVTMRPGYEGMGAVIGRQSVLSFGDRQALAVAYGPSIDDPCRVNINGDLFVNALDLFMFFGWYSTLDPRADWNFDGDINTQDLFDYIIDYTEADICNLGPSPTIFTGGQFFGL